MDVPRSSIAASSLEYSVVTSCRLETNGVAKVKESEISMSKPLSVNKLRQTGKLQAHHSGLIPGDAKAVMNSDIIVMDGEKRQEEKQIAV